jgi:hypothetical protein
MVLINDSCARYHTIQQGKRIELDANG